MVKKYLIQMANLLVASKKAFFWRALFVCLFIAPVVLIASYSSARLYREYTDAVIEQKRSTAILAASVISEKLESAIDLGVSLSMRRKMGELIENGKWQEAIKILHDIPSRFPFIDRIVLYDPNAIIKADSPQATPSVIGESRDYKVWFSGLINGDWKPYVSEVYVRGAEPKMQVVSIVVPIKAYVSDRNERGNITGIMQLQLTLNKFSDWIKQVSAGEGGMIYIVDQGGHIVYHPKFSVRGKPADFSGVPIIQELMKGNDGARVNYNTVEKEKRLAAFEAVSKYGWGVVVTQPVKYVFSERNYRIKQLLAIYFVITLLMFLFARLVLYTTVTNKKTEFQLQKLSWLVESSGDAIISKSTEGIITNWNSGAEKIYGYTDQEIMGKHITLLAPASLSKELSQLLDSIKNGESIEHYETLGRKKNGGIINVSITMSPIKDNSDVIIGASTIARDITNRIKAEEKILKLSLAVEQSPSTIVITDASGKIEYVNPKFTELTGYASEEVVGRNPSILKSGNSTVEFYKELWDTILSGKEWHGEFYNKKKNGEFFWEDASISSVKNSQGKIKYFIAVKEDITERKRVEAALKESRNQYQSLVSNMPGVVYRCLQDKDWTMLYISKHVEVISGYPADDFINNAVRSYESVIDRDDTEYVSSCINEAVGKGVPWEVEYRILHKDGSIKWVYERGSRIKGKDKKTAFLDGFILDITDRKQAENELKIEKWRLESILTGTNAGTWEWNIQTGETVFNERWADMLGYTLKEISPVSIETRNKLCHPDDLKASNELLQQHFNGEQDYYECESRLRHKDGHWVWVLDKGSVFSWTDDRQPLIMFGSSMDISMRKRREEDLFALKEKLADLAIRDQLTGLLNRRGWEECVSAEEQRSQRYKHSSCVIALDLDGLKKINDTHGHGAGDDLLCRTADALKKGTRNVDIVARLGGDEFAVLAIECDEAGGNRTLQRITSILAEEGIAASCGMAVRSDEGGLEGALSKADRSMYEIKAKRRVSDKGNDRAL